MAPKIIIPTSPAELEEMASDPRILAQVMGKDADPDTRKDFLQKYAVATMKNDGSLQAQINEGVQVGIAEFMQRSGEPRESVGARLTASGRPTVTIDGTTRIARGRGAVYNKWSPGADL